MKTERKESEVDPGVAPPEDLILELFRAALKAADPAVAVAKAIQCQGRVLNVNGRRIEVKGRAIAVGVGKAAAAMASGLDLTCGCSIDQGLLLTKDGHARGAPVRFQVREASHPIPDERGVAATREILELVQSCGANDVVIALISGGGSALLEAPRPPLTLDDLAQTTDMLLKAGAPIQDLNAVRIPLSLVKGGGLRAAAPDSLFVTLLLSDVLGNDPRTIASGPTVPGSTGAKEALTVLDRYDLKESVPESVVSLMHELEKMDTVESRHVGNDLVEVVADNSKAVEAACAAAESSGLAAQIARTAMTGEASELGRRWVQSCLVADDEIDVLVGGGEATVTVRGDGSGGRNTEFTLAACQELDRLGIDNWVVASLATDGQDGTTELAGAIGDRETWTRAYHAGIDPSAALKANDSAIVFDQIGGAVKTGPTGTNVNDIYLSVRRRF
jgi:glycerate 2-kinase